ncbi:HAD family hydrolase [Methanofollis fontis]|uniref:hypothetical protein n=1 Tax=Methanofollis fontis TaxID=2052832 RepID=UPI001F3514AA|nr:hypothetical protein [Methanofollis fontis]
MVLTGVQAVLFDCDNTLIDIRTDDESAETCRTLSVWLAYQGIEICRRHKLREIDVRRVRKRAALTFRAASIRHERVFPESRRLLDHLPHLPPGIVSNGQAGLLRARTPPPGHQGLRRRRLLL